MDTQELNQKCIDGLDSIIEMLTDEMNKIHPGMSVEEFTRLSEMAEVIEPEIDNLTKNYNESMNIYD